MTPDDRKKRLHRLELIYVRSPIYFVTTSTFHRRKLLASEATHDAQLRPDAGSPTRIRYNGRSEDNALRLDEVAEEFDLEKFEEKKSGCASLAKDFFRSCASEQ